MFASILEKFFRRQVKGDVRLPVGVDQDQIIFAGLGGHPVAPVGHGHPQVRLRHREVLAADVDDFGIQLDTIDADRTLNRRQLAGDRPAGEADHRHPLGRLARAKIPSQQHLVPVGVGVLGGRVVDRMHGLTLVEHELGLVPDFDDLDVVVSRLRFVQTDTVRRRADRPATKDRQHCDQDREQQVEPAAAAAQKARRRNRAERKRQDKNGRAGPIRGNQPEHRDECPQDASQRRQRIDRAGRIAGGLELPDAKPDHERRDHPEEDHRSRKQDDDRDQRAQHEPHRELGEAGLGQREDRPRDDRDRRGQKRGGGGDLIQQASVGAPIGQPAAGIVADRQVDQDQPDQGPPDEEGLPEKGGEQAGCRELDAQAGEATREGQR